MCVACGCSALYDFAAVRAAVEPSPCGHELDSTATQPGMGFALPCGLGLSIFMYSASTGVRLPPADRDIGVESLNLRVESLYATLGQRLVDLVSFCLETSLNWCGVVRSNQIIVGGSAFPRQHVEVPTEHTKCQRTSTDNVNDAHVSS